MLLPCIAGAASSVALGPRLAGLLLGVLSTTRGEITAVRKGDTKPPFSTSWLKPKSFKQLCQCLIPPALICGCYKPGAVYPRSAVHFMPLLEHKSHPSQPSSGPRRVDGARIRHWSLNSTAGPGEASLQPTAPGIHEAAPAGSPGAEEHPSCAPGGHPDGEHGKGLPGEFVEVSSCWGWRGKGLLTILWFFSFFI